MLQHKSRQPGNHRHPPLSKGGTQRGFTLIEVVLALALTVVLMLAVYNVFGLYRQVTLSGRDDVQRARIARAVVRKMEVDLRSCVFKLPEQQPAAGTEEGSETETVEPLTTEDAIAVNATGIVGDSVSIVIYTSRPGRMLADPSLTGEQTVTSDLRSVSYFLADSSAQGLPGTVGQLLVDLLSDAPRGIQGLARLEGDRLAMAAADVYSDTDAMIQNTHLLAPEINYLQFSYFDGLEWLEEWDSTAMSALPQAVEIVIGFRSTNEYMVDDSPLAQNDVTTDVQRYVVHLPLSDPAILIQQGY